MADESRLNPWIEVVVWTIGAQIRHPRASCTWLHYYGKGGLAS